MTNILDLVRPQSGDGGPNLPEISVNGPESSAIGPGLYTGLGFAVESENSIGSILRFLERQAVEPDPEFALTFEVVERFGQGIGDEYLDAFRSAESLEEMWVIRRQLLTMQESRKQLASMGLTGTALSIGAAIVDPVDIAASTAVAGPVGASLSVATKANRIRRIAAAGLSGAAGAASAELAIGATDPTRGPEDVLYAAAAGVVFGAGLDALGQAVGGYARKARTDIEFRNTVDAAMGAAASGEFENMSVSGLIERLALSPKGLKYFSKQLDELSEGGQRRIADSLIDSAGLDDVADEDLIAELKGLEPRELLYRIVEDPAGDLYRRFRARDQRIIDAQTNAARAAEGVEGEAAPDPLGIPVRTEFKAGDFLPEELDARAGMTGVRRSTASILGSSDDDNVRVAANLMVQDAILKKQTGTDLRIQTDSAEEATRRNVARYTAPHAVEFDTQFHQYAKRTGVQLNSRAQARRDFHRRVGETMMLFAEGRADEFNTAGIDPEVRAAAAHGMETMRQVGEYAQRHGVRGMQNVEVDGSYFPRFYAKDTMRSVEQLFGREALNDLFAEAIRRAQPDIDDNLVGGMARGLVRSILSDETAEHRIARILAGGDAEELRRLIRDEIPGAEDAQIDAILYGSVQSGEPKPITRSANHRVRLDPFTTIDVDGRSLSLQELLDLDADRVVRRYTRQMIGASNATAVYDTMAKRLGTPVNNIEQLKRALERSMQSKGIDKSKVESTLKNIELADKWIRGVPIHPDNAGTRLARRTLAVNNIRLNGTFAAAQLPELSNILGQGVRGLYQSIPALRRWRNDILSGAAIGDEELRHLMYMTGQGVDPEVHRFVEHLGNEINTTAASRGIDRTINAASEFAAKYSGLQGVNRWLQKSALMTTLDRSFHLVAAGKSFSDKRLAQMGLTRADWDRFAAAVKAERARGTITVEVDETIGRRVARLNLDQWEDQVALGRFMAGVTRKVDSVIQRNYLGNLHPFMKTRAGQILLQFRSFVIGAWEKQTLSRIQMRDREATTSALIAMGLGSIVYSLQMYGRSLTMPAEDRAEFLRERLSPQSLFGASVTRAGAFSLLPQFADTGLYFTGFDPMFDYRNSGLSSRFSLDSNPTVQMVQSGARGVRGVAQLAHGDAFTQSDARAVMSLLPFRNMIVFKQALDAAMNQLPERSE